MGYTLSVMSNRIYSSHTATVVDFATFRAWHTAQWGKCYTGPATLADVVRDVLWPYDAAKDCFYRIMGQFASVPGERQDIPWRDVAERYESMYRDFGSYGTN